MRELPENVRLVALAVALALANLIAVYPEEGLLYPGSWFFAAICFCAAESTPAARFRPDWRKVFTVIALSLLTYGSSKYELPRGYSPSPTAERVKTRKGFAVSTVEGKVLGIDRGRAVGEQRVLLQTAGPENDKILLKAPDLPWPPFSDLQTSAVIHATFEYPKSIPELSRSPPWSYEWYLARQGVKVVGRIRDFTVVRKAEGLPSLVDRLIQGIESRLGDSDGLSIVMASSLGRGELLSAATETLFRNTGTTHMLVVSGFHVGVISRFSGRAALFFIRRLPLAFLFAPAPVISAAAGLLAAGLYASAIGLSLTIGRAMAMLAVLAAGSAIGRAQNGARSILVTLCLMMIIWPGCIFEPGCELTFMALAGLSAGDGLGELCKGRFLRPGSLEALLESGRYKLKSWFYEIFLGPLLGCIAVSFATTPVTLLWFQQLVPLSPLLNVAFIPAFTAIVIVVGGTGLIMFGIWEPLGGELLRIAAWGTEILTGAMQRFDDASETTWLCPRKLEWIGALTLGILYLFLFLAIAFVPRLVRRA